METGISVKFNDWPDQWTPVSVRNPVSTIWRVIKEDPWCQPLAFIDIHMCTNIYMNMYTYPRHTHENIAYICTHTMGHCLVTKNRIVFLQKLNWRTSCYTTQDRHGKSSTVCVCFLYVKTKKVNLNVELFNRGWKACLCRGGKEVGFDHYISYSMDGKITMDPILIHN